MNEIIYKLFSYNSKRYDVIIEPKLYELISSKLEKNYLFNLHVYLDSKVKYLQN